MGTIITEPALSQAVGVFDDRNDAGLVTAALILRHFDEETLKNAAVVAIPAGGVPVGLMLARRLNVPFDLIFIRKLHFPDNPEAGFGAVTEHGALMINEALAARLSRQTLERVIALEREALAERIQTLRRHVPPLSLTGRTAIIADDGLASGFTMLAAIEEARRRGAERVIVAVPTASEQAARRVAAAADAVVVPNLRGGPWFAVAEAYRHWRDLTLDEVAAMLDAWQQEHGEKTSS
ncbi:phosphoribosyltransferase [Thermopetrobacter sp. TC1]|uniref:phosphoribosyltransferase n=1 Tax=Thermopetrobacter sp. TC1 TaxID=1495045 RepID=UPI00068ECDB8|nr:phosphoribosyltransferase family protein [Thermopetrobacter sp. TC1]